MYNRRKIIIIYVDVHKRKEPDASGNVATKQSLTFRFCAE